MFDGIFDSLRFGVFSIIYYPFFALPMILLRHIVKLFKLVAMELPQYLLLGIRPFESFSGSKLPTLFLRLAIISMLVFTILFIFSIVKVNFQKDNEESPIKIAIKHSFIGTIWIMFLPLGLYVFNLFSTTLLELIVGNSSQGLDNQIWNSFYNKDTFYSGTISLEEYRAIPNNPRNPYYINKETFKLMFPESGYAPKWVMVGIFSSVATLVPMALGFLTLISKAFQQLYLFILAPFIASASVVDSENKRMKEWQRMYMGKSLSILAFLIGIQIFGIFVERSVEWTKELTELDNSLRLIITIGVIIGGAVAATSSADLITAFLGESASIRKSLSEAKNTIAAGASLASGVAAVGVASKKAGAFLAKSGVGASHMLGRRLSNTRLGNSKLGRGISAMNKRMEAKRNLKEAFKNGDIDREEYISQKRGLKELFKEQKNNLKEDNDLRSQEKEMMKSSIALNGKNSPFRESDLNASDSKLMKNERETINQMEKLQKQGKVDSDEFLALQNRQQALSSLIDKRNERKAGLNLTDAKKNKEQMLLNSKRKSLNVSLAPDFNETKEAKQRLQNKMLKNEFALKASGQWTTANQKVQNYTDKMSSIGMANENSATNQAHKNLIKNITNIINKSKKKVKNATTKKH